MLSSRASALQANAQQRVADRVEALEQALQAMHAKLDQILDIINRPSFLHQMKGRPDAKSST